MADGVFTVHIGSFQFVIEPLVTPETEFDHAPNGDMLSRLERWNLHGFITGNQDSLKSDRDTIRNQIQNGIQVVEIKKDGSTHIKLDPSFLLRSPRFENFREVGNPASLTNHIEFFIDLIAETSLKISGVVEPSEITDELQDSDGNLIITKRVFARGPGAEAYVKSFKPRTRDLREFRTIFNKFEDTWESMSIRKISKIAPEKEEDVLPGELIVDEVISEEGGINETSWGIRDANLPLPIGGGLTPAIIRIDGTMRSLDQSSLKGTILFSSLDPELILPKILSFSQSGITIDDFASPGKPIEYSRNYSATFGLAELINVGEITSRFTITAILQISRVPPIGQ